MGQGKRRLPMRKGNGEKCCSDVMTAFEYETCGEILLNQVSDMPRKIQSGLDDWRVLVLRVLD